LRRIHDAYHANADQVTIWGSGKPLREFLHVDDLASACLCVMQQEREKWTSLITPQCSHINVGSGEEISIAELAQLIASIVGYEGRLFFDKSKPDGTPRKFLDSSKIKKMGWSARIPLREGILRTYRHFLSATAASHAELVYRGPTLQPRIRF
jgi:nucleoside-diphosphate-sugar epimerase